MATSYRSAAGPAEHLSVIFLTGICKVFRRPLFLLPVVDGAHQPTRGFDPQRGDSHGHPLLDHELTSLPLACRNTSADCPAAAAPT
jgi:hypothetical protein